MHVRQTLALAPILAFPASDVREQGPWSEPVTLDRGAVAAPSAAVDERDRVAATWLRGPREVRALVPGGRVVTVARSPRRRLLTPEVATTTRGAVVAWTRAGRVESRRVTAGGRLSLVSQLSPAGRRAFEPTFVGGTGGTVLAWQLGTGVPQLQLGIPRSDGSFLRTLRYGLGDVAELDFTTTRSGGLLAAYTRRAATGGSVELVVAEQRPGSRELVEIGRMATIGLPREPHVAVTAAGRSVIAWTESEPASGGRRVVMADRRRGGTFGAPVTLAPAAYASRLSLVPKADGAVLATWIAGERLSPASPGALRVVDTAGGTPRTVTRPGERIRDYAVTADGRGAAHFGWITSGGAVTAGIVDEAERVGTRRRLSHTGERARALSLSAGRRGVAAIWTTASAVRASGR
jgi:hypothetical protein